MSEEMPKITTGKSTTTKHLARQTRKKKLPKLYVPAHKLSLLLPWSKFLFFFCYICFSQEPFICYMPLIIL